MKSVRELMSLEGRVALVTGAAGRLGAVFSETLAELGAGVVILDTAEERCLDLAARLGDVHGVRILPLVVDLGVEEAVLEVPAKVLDAFNRLDILINCAGLVGTSQLKGWAVPFQDQSSEAWRLALEINLTAPFVLTQACAPALKQSGHGSVINISSIYGLVGPDFGLYEGLQMGNPAAYGAAKGGLLQLTRYLATALAPDVRVNAISPGGVWAGQAESFHARYVQRTPLRRMASEEDFKGAIAYLASDLSGYVTGHNLVVDGGWTAW